MNQSLPNELIEMIIEYIDTSKFESIEIMNTLACLDKLMYHFVEYKYISCKLLCKILLNKIDDVLRSSPDPHLVLLLSIARVNYGRKEYIHWQEIVNNVRLTTIRYLQFMGFSDKSDRSFVIVMMKQYSVTVQKIRLEGERFISIFKKKQFGHHYLSNQKLNTKAFSISSIRPMKKILIIGGYGIGKKSFMSAVTPDNDGTIDKPISTMINTDAGMKYTTLFQVTTVDTSAEVIVEQMYFVFSDIHAMCYSVASRESLEILKTRWIPISKSISNKPIVIIALQTDLRDSCDNCISSEEGMKFAMEYHCAHYCECTNTSLESMYQCIRNIVLVSDITSLQRNKKCSIQ
jgi:GTPase SAR1 family protein